jgi:hypothetical protein
VGPLQKRLSYFLSVIVGAQRFALLGRWLVPLLPEVVAMTCAQQ